MQPKTSISHTNCRVARRLFRWGLLTVALVALVGLSLTLVACSAGDGTVEGVEGNMAVVDEWIQAVNDEDAAQFEKLHTETAAFHPYIQSSGPSSGRQNVWDAFSHSYAPLQKIYMLGQDDFVCLQVTAADPKRSLLYFFRFEKDLIAEVHEYSAVYDLSDALCLMEQRSPRMMLA